MEKYLTLNKYNLQQCINFADKQLKKENLTDADRIFLSDIKTDSELLIKIIDVLLNSKLTLNQMLDKFGLSFTRFRMAMKSSTFKFTNRELKKINNVLNN